MSDDSNPVLTAPLDAHAGHDDHGSHSGHGAAAHGHGTSGHAESEAYSVDIPMWIAGAIGIGAGIIIALCFVFAGALH